MNLYEAIFVRKSVRNYCFDTLPPQTLDKIWEHYKEMPALFSGIGVDMAILDNRKGQERMLSMFSVKAPYYMAFYSEESERYLMNVGYIMEQMVLYLCSIGLGTCFIGSNRVKKAELEKIFGARIEILSFPDIPVSSTLIRERIKHGENIRYLVPESVRNYMEEKHIYTE